MHHIVRLAADAPRAGIFLQLVTGLGSKGHGAMQVRNENTLCRGSKCGVVQNQDQIKVPHLYKKQRPKIPFFGLAHNFFFFCTVGAYWKRKSKHTQGHLCDRNCTCEEEEGAEQLALELWLRCRPAALQCVSDPRHQSLTPPVFPFLLATCCNSSTVHGLA